MRRRAPGARSRALSWTSRAALVAPAAVVAALVASPRPASAYPTSVIFAPSGDVLPFGNFSLVAFSAISAIPQPVAFANGTFGVGLGVLPSLELITTPAGKLSFGGGEIGLDLSVNNVGHVTFMLNAKIQLIEEGKYWPATSIGFFQLSPDRLRNTFLGYFVASKGFTIRDVNLGQLTFGMARSFTDSRAVSPQCFKSRDPCLFVGSPPFEDQNSAFLAGYFSPWLSVFNISVDYMGGTSDISSANVAVNIKLWSDDRGGLGLVGLGGFLSVDRRPSPPGPGTVDGLFIQAYFSGSLSKLLRLPPVEEWSRPPKQLHDRDLKRGKEDPLAAPPIKPAEISRPPP